MFPSMFDGVFADSIIRRALDRKLISIGVSNIRDFARDKHRSVDDYPYGGDPGMVLKPEPLSRALDAALDRLAGKEPKVVFLSPQGEPLDHGIVQELSGETALVLLCGRYKGIDQRIRDRYVEREISIGDYVLSGGEIGAMVIVDTITRLIPGVLGNLDSAEQDSFFDGLLGHPQYTRPEIFEGVSVPEVLLSGHHGKIAEWQRAEAREMTRGRRPDLWSKYQSRSVQGSV